MSKLTTLTEAIRENVHDGDSVYITGFTHLIGFSAGHEIIRQKKKDLNLIRMTPDVIYDQMIAAGVAAKLTFSYSGNPGVGSLRCIRRAIEKREPLPIEVEEYTHGSLISALFAGASRLPFYPVPAVDSTDLRKYNSQYRVVRNPYSGKNTTVVGPLNPDVGIIHVQRADENGNAQMWGIIGEQKEVAFASSRVIVSAEEIIDHDLVFDDPNRTIVPGIIVSAVVQEPYASHPSYAQGYYDRDNRFYREWNEISKSESEVKKYLEEWVYSVSDRAEYVSKLPSELIRSLSMTGMVRGNVNFGGTGS